MLDKNLPILHNQYHGRGITNHDIDYVESN